MRTWRMTFNPKKQKDSVFCQYFLTNTTDARRMYNTANFYIRNTMTGIKKSPELRTPNEVEVLHDVFTGIQKANKAKDSKYQKDLEKYNKGLLDKHPKRPKHFPYPTTRRVHTTFGQATAVTGRLASSDPNLQNIPVRTEEGRRVREAFVAERGSVIVSADYSQVELRIMAHLSKDRGLLDAFARGEDIHRSTAAEVFGRPIEAVTPDERRMAKVINFGLIYGMSAFGLAQNLGIDRRVAANYIDAYFTRYPGVKRYMDEMRALAHEQGFVETVFGRRLWIPDIKSGRKPVQAAAERAAINAPMQGTAADVIKKAMIAVDAWLRERKLGARLVLQVHDELILEVPEAEVELVKTEVPKLMREAAELEVPLIAEVGSGDSWEAAH